MIPVALICLGIISCLFCFFQGFVRNDWVYWQRRKWIEQDVVHFKRHAPSYDYMVNHFWIWDARKFGAPFERETEGKS